MLTLFHFCIAVSFIQNFAEDYLGKHLEESMHFGYAVCNESASDMTSIVIRFDFMIVFLGRV